VYRALVLQIELDAYGVAQGVGLHLFLNSSEPPVG
jgi:hypothetical protein